MRHKLYLEGAFGIVRRSSSAGNGAFIVERDIVKGKYSIVCNSRSTRVSLRQEYPHAKILARRQRNFPPVSVETAISNDANSEGYFPS